MFKVIWNGHEIDELSEPWNDMWRLEGKWKSYNSDLSHEFEERIKSLDIKKVFTNPEYALKVILQDSADPQNKIYCLATFLKDQSLILRELVAEKALDMFFPDR